jgi:hypothetical protein
MPFLSLFRIIFSVARGSIRECAVPKGGPNERSRVMFSASLIRPLEKSFRNEIIAFCT